MTRNALATIAVAAMLVLAGCAGGIGGAPGTSANGPNGDGTSDGAAGESGQVAFYVSDRPGAIDQFEHLNVTISKVGLHKVDGDDSDEVDAEADDDDDANETTANGTTVETAGDADANASVETNATTGANATTEADAEADVEAEAEVDDESDDDGEDGRWVEHQVDSKTVDLTELRGANASKLDVLNASAGEYDKVFVYVSDVDATLNDGSSANVKLPSGKLHINKGFTVGEGEDVEFVFDIMVHEAGNSGKYILKPVVAESGTSEEVDIADVDAGEDHAAENETDGDLSVQLPGRLDAGSNATLTVTADGEAVANATVSVDGEVVGTTDADGELVVTVPDAEDVEVAVEKGDLEGELEKSVKQDGGNGNGNGGNGNGSGDDSDEALSSALPA